METAVLRLASSYEESDTEQPRRPDRTEKRTDDALIPSPPATEPRSASLVRRAWQATGKRTSPSCVRLAKRATIMGPVGRRLRLLATQ